MGPGVPGDIWKVRPAPSDNTAVVVVDDPEEKSEVITEPGVTPWDKGPEAVKAPPSLLKPLALAAAVIVGLSFIN